MGVCVSNAGESRRGLKRPSPQICLHGAPDVVKGELPPDVQRFNKETFAKFCDPSSSFLVWRDLLGMSEPPHQRVELYLPPTLKVPLYFDTMHAAVTLQRYLILLDRRKRGAEGEDDPGLVDVGMYSGTLNSRISNFSSYCDILYRLEQFTSGTKWKRFEYYGVANSPSKLEEHLRKYGPALMEGFGVRASFRDEPGPFLGATMKEGCLLSLHAMLIVGCRWEGSELRLLLQCWWAHKQFVEVDLGYVWRCCHGLQISFALTPQSYIPAEHDVVLAGVYGDSSGVYGEVVEAD